MANHNTDHEIRTRIDSFLSELSQLVKQQALDAVHEVLGGTARTVRGPGRPRKVTIKTAARPRAIAKRALRGKRIRRSSVDLAKIQASVLAQIRSKQGQRLEEIGKSMKTDTSVLKRPIALLLAAKKLKTKGQKRGTKYFVK